MANGTETRLNWIEQAFPRCMDELSDYWEHTSKSKGFMEEGELNGMPEVHIGLLHGEVSEAMESMRQPVMPQSQKIPDFTLFEEELADIIIRTFILAKLCDIDGARIARAVLAKSRYNESRPMMHGGKRF